MSGHREHSSGQSGKVRIGLKLEVRTFYVGTFYVRTFYIGTLYVRTFYVMTFYVRTFLRQKILGMSRIEPGAAGREARMLSTVPCGPP